MADQKITELTQGAPASTDVLVYVDLSGTPTTKKATVAGLLTGYRPAVERLTPTQSGGNVTLDLTALSNTFTSILGVSRQGAAVTPTLDPNGGSAWTRAANTLTVTNAGADEVFLVHYLY